MKIQCDVCEKAEAEVLCCADEAVLCRGCDEKVHAANKLSQKHERFLLLKNPSSPCSSSSSHGQLFPCDICQQRNGNIFCLEDRKLFCRHCDVATHSGTSFAASHQRFLISGVKVALQASMSGTDTSFDSRNSPKKTATSFNSLVDNESRAPMTMEVEAASAEGKAIILAEPPFEIGPSWPLDEIFNVKQFNCYEFQRLNHQE